MVIGQTVEFGEPSYSGRTWSTWLTCLHGRSSAEIRSATHWPAPSTTPSSKKACAPPCRALPGRCAARPRSPIGVRLNGKPLATADLAQINGKYAVRLVPDPILVKGS